VLFYLTILSVLPSEWKIIPEAHQELRFAFDRHNESIWSKLFPTRSKALTTELSGKPFITSSWTLEGYSSTGKSRCGGVGEDDEDSLPRAAANATEEDAAAAASGMLSCDGQGRLVVAEVATATAAAATAGVLWSPFIVFGLELSPVEGLDFAVVDFVFVEDALCFLPSSFWL
jgi:hypothetical protein